MPSDEATSEGLRASRSDSAALRETGTTAAIESPERDFEVGLPVRLSFF